MKATVVCPYCEHKNIHALDLNKENYEKFHTVYCDIEEGGCDMPFTFSINPVVTFEVETFELIKPPFDEVAVVHKKIDGLEGVVEVTVEYKGKQFYLKREGA